MVEGAVLGCQRLAYGTVCPATGEAVFGRAGCEHESGDKETYCKLHHSTSPVFASPL